MRLVVLLGQKFVGIWNVFEILIGGKMEFAFYNLSGGINQSLTKTELGLDTKRMYWADSKNVELLKNNGIKKQRGNAIYCELPVKEEITGLHQFTYQDSYKLIVTTISGKVYVYDEKARTFTTVNLKLTGTKPCFKNFLNGFVGTNSKK